MLVYCGDWLSVPTDTQYCYASLNLPFFSMLSLSLFWFYLLYLFCTCVFFIIHILGAFFLSIPSVFCCCWNCNKFPRLVIKWHVPRHICKSSGLYYILLYYILLIIASHILEVILRNSVCNVWCLWPPFVSDNLLCCNTFPRLGLTGTCTIFPVYIFPTKISAKPPKDNLSQGKNCPQIWYNCAYLQKSHLNYVSYQAQTRWLWRYFNVNRFALTSLFVSTVCLEI